MLKKINSRETATGLTIGQPIFKYPLDGNPLPQNQLSDTDTIEASVYIVELINDEDDTISLELPIDLPASTSLNKALLTVGNGTDEGQVLYTKISALINEGCWWMEE